MFKTLKSNFNLLLDDLRYKNGLGFFIIGWIIVAMYSGLVVYGYFVMKLFFTWINK